MAISWDGQLPQTPNLTTRQSLVYNAILGRRAHPSAQTIHRQISDLGKNISLATIYRQLNNLVGLGLINPIELGEETRYCPGQRAHAHLHCKRCDRLTNVKTNEDTISDLVSSVNTPKSERCGEELCFEIQIIITGICDDCITSEN